MNSISLKNVTKKYKEFKLDNISFDLPMGCIMGLIGENGAGKTTTINLILNLINRDSGEIQIFDKDNITHEKLVKQDIGVALGESNFPETLTVKDIETVLKNIYKNWDSKLYNHYVMRFGLPLKKSNKEFSTGMKAKLSLACALAHHPKLLILDEATSGLDPVARMEILDVFLDFIQDEQHSVLISSHIISDLEKICDYITFINKGKILLSQEKDALINNYGILKCSKDDFSRVDKSYIKASRASEFSLETLIYDKESFIKKYPTLTVDTANIEQIMLMLITGNRDY